MANLTNHRQNNHSEAPGPLNVLHGLHGLWAARVISQDAFFLGAQVCQQLSAGGLSEVIYSGADAHVRYTTLSGTIYTGPISKSLHSYIRSLQDLHILGGLLSYLHDVDHDPDETALHFTLDSRYVSGRDYDFSTPIHFRVTRKPKAALFELLNRQAADKLSKCSSLQIVEY